MIYDSYLVKGYTGVRLHKTCRKAGFEPVKLINWKWKPSIKHIINWGCIVPLAPDEFPILNHPQYVRQSSHKGQCLKAWAEAGLPTVPWTRNRMQAQKWLDEGEVVISRQRFRSCKGQGMEVVHPCEPLPYAKWYSRYVGPNREYRIHVFRGEVLVSQKKRRNNVEQNDYIKNLANGWVYCFNHITPVTPEVVDVAVKAVETLGLDFAALDMITRHGKPMLLEANSAPSVSSNTVHEFYVNQFRRYKEEKAA